MKKWKRRLYAAFVCVILLAGSMRAYAAETTRFTLPVSYTWGKDGLIAGKKYQAVLSAGHLDMPMPEGSEQGSYTLDLKSDAVRTDFPEIVYDTVGEYAYHMKVVREDQKIVGEFVVSVTVTNGEEGGLILNFSVRSQDQDAKKVGELTAVDKSGRDAPDESESKTSGETETSRESETESSKASETKNGKYDQPKENETRKNTATSGSGGTGNNRTASGVTAAAGTNRSAKTGDDTRAGGYLLLCMGALTAMYLAGRSRKGCQSCDHSCGRSGL